MIVNKTTNPSFKALIEPYKKEYSPKQEKLAERIREILNSTNPEDVKGRSYTQFYKEDFGLDLYIKPSNERHSIDVSFYDEKMDTFDYMCSYKNVKPKEKDFLMYAKYLKDDMNELLEKIFTFSVVTLLASLVFWVSNKTNSVKNVEKLKNIELVQNNQNVEKATSLIKKM